MNKIETLWNDEFGLYLNKDLVTGKFSYRLSPTLNYHRLARVPDQEKATPMDARSKNLSYLNHYT